MSETILFVDSEEHLLNSLEGIFSVNHFRYLKASNAADALRHLSREQVAVAVMDSRMTDIAGTGFLTNIREASPDTIRMMMTENTDIARAVDAISRGDIYRFILKPLNITELLHILEDAVKRFQLVLSLKNEDRTSLLSVAQTLESRDYYSIGHSERVVTYALMIASTMGLSDEIKNHLESGCWLHDLGKIDIPLKILNKKQPLIKEEYELIKNHPAWGAALARQADLPGPVLDIILHHHERYDGSGYPSGMKGNDIPLPVRIATVADVYVALTSERAYRTKHPVEKAVDIMTLMKGNVFDPGIFDTFLKSLEHPQQTAGDP